MRKYILALILGIGIVFQGQSVYAQVEDVDSDNTLATQTIDKNILADEKLMKTITPEQLEEYIAQGADVNAKDIMGFTALMYAVADKDHKLNIIETLLKNGADVNAKSNDGYTPLLAAMHGENPETIVLLLERGANFNEIGDYLTILFAVSAMEEPKPQIIKTLIKKGASVDAKDTNGVTALHIASGLTPEMFRIVIERSADVDAQMSPDGITPLMFATLVKNPEIVEMLLKHGANTEIKDNNGETALIYAIKQNSEEIIEMLIKSGANVNAKSSTGNSLLYWAIRENGENDTISKKIVETLLDYDAVPNDEELVPILKSDYLDDALKDKIYNVWKEQNITKTKKEKLNNLTDSISMLISTISTLYSNQDSYKNLSAQKVDEYASSPDYKKYDMTIKPADALKKGDNKAFSLKINKLSKDICTYIATIKWWTNDIKFGTPKLGKYQNTPLTIENAKKACECEYNKCSVFIKVSDK